MKEEYIDLWKKCINFHGHECGGLAVGFQAALYAKELLECSEYSFDEEIVCVSENDACGVDAIQVILGCTVGKGNLIFNMQGKNAYSFYNRKNGKSVRLVLQATPDKSKEERLNWLMNDDYHKIFTVKKAGHVPEKARIFKNYICASCGEIVAESYVHLQNGETVCSTCFSEYTRGL